MDLAYALITKPMEHIKEPKTVIFRQPYLSTNALHIGPKNKIKIIKIQKQKIYCELISWRNIGQWRVTSLVRINEHKCYFTVCDAIWQK